MQIVIYIFEDFTPLEVFGPYDLLSKFSDVEIKLVSERRGVIHADNNSISLNIKYSIDDIQRADVLLIPGSTVGWTQIIHNSKVLNWINSIDKTTRYTAAMCSGPIILAAAGVLRGKKATAFWRVASLLQNYNVEYIDQAIVRDDKYLTSDGVSSSMDMAMQIGDLLFGDRDVKISQLLLAYESKRLTALNDLFKDKNLVETADAALIKEAKETLSIFNKILNVKMLLRLKNRK